MSPEQAKGRPADKRSDIWAFGCVVHEMLTGRRVFGGGEVEDAIANVLTTEPSWDALPAKTPVSVRRMLRRCLERDPRQRLRAIGDAQLELLDATTSSKTEHDVPASARAQGRRERLAWAVAFGLLSAVVALGAAHQFRSPPTARELHVDVNTPPTNDVASFAISPDGRAIAFVALDRGQQQLWVRSLESSALRRLAGTEGARLPFWSPDGKSLGFFVDTRLKRLDLDSGAIQTLAPVVTPGGGTWNRDGMILYVPNNGIGPIMQVAASGGEPAAIAQLNPTNIGNRQPSFLPDGRHFLFFVAGGPNPRGVYLGELGRNNPKRLLTADAPALYAAGHLLFVRDTILFAQPFDLDKGEPGGRVIHVADAVDVNSSGIVALSTSADGSIAYRSGRSEGVRALIWFDRAGNQIGGPVGSSLPAARVGIALSNPALSPDGSRLAVQHGGDIWILDVNRDVANRFTSDPGIEALPVWSPDGLRIVFDSPRQGPADLYVKRTDDSSPEQLLLATPEAKFPADWSPDGHLLLYKTVNAKTGTYDMWALPVVGAAKPFPIVRTDFDERDGQFSPDGKWLAYESNESGRPDIYVQPFPGPGVKTRISAAGGTQTRWRSDGRELFYVAPDNRLMAVRFDGSGGHVTVASPVPLFATHILASAGILRQQYVVSRDGQRFLMNTMTGEATASSISLILHWADKS
jgi:Tol biopolymer transport system component